MDVSQAWAEPENIADLRLPPTFLVDHGIRTLSYQGPVTPVELAAHWRVHDNAAIEITQALKAAGLVEIDHAQANFDRTGRMRLTAAGEARVEAARQRTRYAGPLPVSLAEFERRVDVEGTRTIDREGLTAALSGLAIDAAAITAIGQAVAAGRSIALVGTAYDEQRPIAAALGASLTGEITLPYALYASGSIVRVYDPRCHQTSEHDGSVEQELDILRARAHVSRWAAIRRPLVVVAGGVRVTDSRPAHDADARFYISPPAFAACGGILAILDADSDREGLTALASDWLIPGRYGTGVMTLLTGERIEAPWRASVALMSEEAPALARPGQRALDDTLDISALAGDQLRAFAGLRLSWLRERRPGDIERFVDALGRTRMATRPVAARACAYLAAAARYEGTSFTLDDGIVGRAVDAAGGAASPAPLRRVS